MDYASASIIDGFPDGAPQAGDLVRAEGDLLGPSGELLADELARPEREDGCGTTLLRGFVAAAAEPALTILGIIVLTDGSTDFPGGSAAASFAAAPGRLVEARGDVVGPNLLAEQLQFKD